MNIFEQELAAGFSELATEAGTGASLTFKGLPMVGVFSEGDTDPLRTDTRVGPEPIRLNLMISRAYLATLPAYPKVGESFDYAGGKLSIKDVGGNDPSDPVVTFVVKRV
jgi:hypothetical protein